MLSTTSWLLYSHTVNLLTKNLHKRLESIATTAAVLIEASDVEALQIEADWKKPEWAKVVTAMEEVRKTNTDILFVYIFRKTSDDPTKMEFVADSHSLDPYANMDDDPTNDVDPNGDGIIDGVDVLQWPGQPYPGPPEETFEAYEGPTTNRELYEDQWGKVITGYAPIRRQSGETVAVLAVDIKADDFFTITTQTLLPFLAFIAFLGGTIIMLVIILMRIAHHRISLVKELDRQKDELVSIVSHQLVTPVSAAKFIIEMLQDDKEHSFSAEQKQELKTVYSELEGLSDLVNNILNVSRLELGRMRADRTEVNLQQCIQFIVQGIEPLAKRKGIHLDVHVPKNMPNAFLDQNLFRITMKNLLDNAVKYTPKGGSIFFTVHLTKEHIRYEVRDTGCGIPADEQDQIFGKMFRASNAQEIEGSGFGLYAAAGAAESLDGNVRFESTENEGTTFFVEIPLEES